MALLLSACGGGSSSVGSSSGVDGGSDGTPKPQAEACAALKSGTYRVVDGSAGMDFELRAQIDAEALRIGLPGLDGGTVALTNEGRCSFSFPDASGTGRLLVASSGMAVLRRQRSGSATGPTDVSFALPEQTLPVSELAGLWNVVKFARNGENRMEGEIEELSLKADGSGVVGTRCDARWQDCLVTEPPFPVTDAWWRYAMRSASVGGFHLVKDGAPIARVHAFKTADGQPVMVMNLNGQGVALAAPYREVRTAPPVGSVSRFWDFQVQDSGQAGALTSEEVTVTAVVDTPGLTASRRRASDGRTDQQVYNQPLLGMRFGITGGCPPHPLPLPVNCSGAWGLDLPGMVVYAGLAPTIYLGISVLQP
jgi:hypothetical protein